MSLPILEARLKKCPFLRDGTCCADDCMMWRWTGPVPRKKVIRHTENCPRSRISLSMMDVQSLGECIACGAPLIEITLVDERKGYCGLAGPALE